MGIVSNTKIMLVLFLMESLRCLFPLHSAKHMLNLDKDHDAPGLLKLLDVAHNITEKFVLNVHQTNKLEIQLLQNQRTNKHQIIAKIRLRMWLLLGLEQELLFLLQCNAKN